MENVDRERMSEAETKPSVNNVTHYQKGLFPSHCQSGIVTTATTSLLSPPSKETGFYNADLWRYAHDAPIDAWREDIRELDRDFQAKYSTIKIRSDEYTKGQYR